MTTTSAECSDVAIGLPAALQVGPARAHVRDWEPSASRSGFTVTSTGGEVNIAGEL